MTGSRCARALVVEAVRLRTDPEARLAANLPLSAKTPIQTDLIQSEEYFIRS